MHDLGKAITPEDILPSHHGHETAGLARIKQFCKRWKVPRLYKELALSTAEFHTHVHRAFSLKNTTLLKFMIKAGALRQPDQFERLLNACIADIRGRTGFENAAYPQAAFLKDLASHLRNTSVQSIVDSGVVGEQLGNAIYRYRLTLAAQFDRSAYQPDE